MLDNSWSQTSELTIQYDVPETGSAGFMGVTLPPEEYDSYHVGQRVSLHYLRSKDVPDFPTSRILRQMHLLPTARLANQRAFSFLDDIVPAGWLLSGAVALMVVVILSVWRLVARSTFWWPMGLTIAVAIALMFFFDFPRPTQQPRDDLRRATGKVTNINHINYLLRTHKSRGIDTKQPIDVVQVEFTPASNPDPVLAVDLIDANSIAGMNEGSTVEVVYESKSPRTAHLVAARRNFYVLNFEGAIEQGTLYLLVLLAFFVLLPWLWSRRRPARA